jgi:N-acetyl-beta-hexosaminidase|tara:strand:- start:521 stop:994 length:474 start_codon:yes stop_codon:yes gene_type:complete
MEILIKIADGSEVARWGSPPKRIAIPTEKVTVDPGAETRPLAVGDNHFLAIPTIVKPDLKADEKRGAESINVDGQTVTITCPAVDMTDADKTKRTNDAIAVLRETRNKLLVSCDWTQAADSPLTDEVIATWATYRQALRDLPANTSDPLDVTWPDAP